MEDYPVTVEEFVRALDERMRRHIAWAVSAPEGSTLAKKAFKRAEAFERARDILAELEQE